MPSVQSAFGPIVEPGWPSTLPGQPDLVGSFQSAMQLKAQMNAKQQQLENQAMQYALRAEGAERSRELAGMRFEQQQQVDQWNHEKTVSDYEYKNRQLTDLNTHRDRVDEIRDAQLKLDQTNSQNKWDKSDALLRGANYLASIPARLNARGLFEGEPGYLEAYNAELAAVPPDHAFPGPQLSAANRTVRINTNKKSFDKSRLLNEDIARWEKDLGKTVWGTEQWTDTYPVFYPEVLKPQMTGGGWDPPFGRKEKKPTGKLIVDSWGPDGAYERYVDPAELRRLRKEWRALEKRSQGIVKQSSDPTLGVNEIEELPKDPKDWRINHTYMGPKGPATWNGVDWTPYY